MTRSSLGWWYKMSQDVAWGHDEGRVVGGIREMVLGDVRMHHEPMGGTET